MIKLMISESWAEKLPPTLRDQTGTSHFLTFPAALDQVAEKPPPRVIWQDQSDMIQMEGLLAPDFVIVLELLRSM